MWSDRNASACCPDRVWDAAVAWNTTNPRLTECFADTLLCGVPCGALWLACPLWLARVVRRKAGCGAAAAAPELSKGSPRI